VSLNQLRSPSIDQIQFENLNFDIKTKNDLQKALNFPILLTLTEIIPSGKKQKEEKINDLGYIMMDFNKLIKNYNAEKFEENLIYLDTNLKTETKVCVSFNFLHINSQFFESCEIGKLALKSIHNLPESILNAQKLNSQENWYLECCFMKLSSLLGFDDSQTGRSHTKNSFLDTISLNSENIFEACKNLNDDSSHSSSQNHYWPVFPNLTAYLNSNCSESLVIESESSNFDNSPINYDFDHRNIDDSGKSTVLSKLTAIRKFNGPLDQFISSMAKNQPQNSFELFFNRLIRIVLDRKDVENLRGSLSLNNGILPLEVCINSSQGLHSTTSKTKNTPSSIKPSFHAVAQCNFNNLLFPGNKRVTGVFRVNSFEPSKINSKNESTNNSVKSSNIHLNNLSNSSNSPTNARNTLKPDTKPQSSNSDSESASNEQKEFFPYVVAKFELENPLFQAKSLEDYAKRTKKTSSDLEESVIEKFGYLKTNFQKSLDEFHSLVQDISRSEIMNNQSLYDAYCQKISELSKIIASNHPGLSNKMNKSELFVFLMQEAVKARDNQNLASHSFNENNYQTLSLHAKIALNHLHFGCLKSAQYFVSLAISDDGNNAKLWFILAKIYAKDKKFEFSITALEKCISLDAKNEEYLLMLAMCYSLSNKLEKSVETARYCSKLHPKSSLGLLVLLEVEMQENERSPYVDDCLEKLKKFESHQNLNFIINECVELSNECFCSQFMNATIQILNKNLIDLQDLDENMANYSIQKNLLERDMIIGFSTEKLLQKIESFLTKQPELSFCWFVAGKIMEEGFEDFERAKEFYERCLSFQGGICGLENPLRAFLHLGRAMEKIGQLEEAIEFYRIAQHYCDFEIPAKRIGICYFELAKYTEAEKFLSKSNCINNSDSETWNYLQKIALLSENQEKANFCQNQSKICN